MSKGVIVKVNKGYTGIIRGEDGREYRFNRKGIVQGEKTKIVRGRVVEFAPEGQKAVQIRLLDEMQEVTSSKAKSSGQRKRPIARRGSVRQPETSGYRFLNPYNFVRFLNTPRPEGHVLGNCPPPPHDRYVGLTGRITCQVEAVTPLFISDSHAIQEEIILDENGRERTHYTYRFFQLDGKPAIPASSLRGMIRSVFEAVTNSCFAVLDQNPLSHRFDSRRAPWLVPARVERHGDRWQLRLLTGTTPLQLESPGKKSPDGKQYAAWNASYWPLKPSKTLRGIGPRGRKLSGKQKRNRDLFIKRTQNHHRNPDNVTHGEECYALLRPFQHPHPKIRFWDVVEIRRNKEDLPKPNRERGERIEKGWLCITNQNIEPKHSERFFFRAKDNRTGPELIDLPEKVREAYEALIGDYQKRHHDAVARRRNPGKPLKDEPAFSRFIYRREERTLQGGELVYAFLEGTVNAPRVKFIAPVSVPRISYEQSIGNLLPNHLHKCQDIKNLCPACRTFGWVRENAPENTQEPVAYAGRVRFTHGTLPDGVSPSELPETTLAILSTPKPTTTPFYLLDKDGQPDPMVTYDTEGARLRGRKFYRHQGEAKELEYQRTEKSDQNRTVRGVLKPGATFTFTVDFENLAPLELGALLYALELEEDMYHRLGYAKPLGFGSVKITVEKVEIVNWQKRLQSIEAGTGWNSVSEQHWKQYKANFLHEMRQIYGSDFDEVLADLRALLGNPPDLPIHYPRPTKRFDPDHPQFEWFVGNKRRIEDKRRGKGNLPEPVALPLAKDDKRGLPLMDKKGKEVK